MRCINAAGEHDKNILFNAVYQVEFERDAVLQALINRSDVPANEILDRVHRAGAKRRDPGMGGT